MERSETPPRRGLGTWEAAGLLGWITVAGALMWTAPAPPEAPATTPEEEAVRARMVTWAVRDAQEWEAQEGDLNIPWDAAEGHLAIVIDDVGRELHWHEALQSLRHRITFSVLPGSPYAAGAQLRLGQDDRRPREVLLHLPMEPQEASLMHEGREQQEEFLLSTDEPEVLRAKLERALERVPDAVGINNHMGSRLTIDCERMSAIMPVLASRGLFFIDSRTTPETCAASAAVEAGVKSRSRQVFLDHDPSPEAITQALAQAAELSVEGPVIAIAHPSQAVVEVLERDLPGLHERRIGIYPVSEVLQRAGGESPRDTMVSDD